MLTPKHDTKPVHHPVVDSQFERRASDVQLRLADRITAFAGVPRSKPSAGTEAASNLLRSTAIARLRIC